MTIKYNDIEFNVVDNADGTFTLTPASAFVYADVVAEYREVRDLVKRKVAYKQKIQDKLADVNDELTALRAKRDELKIVLDAANADPDGDPSNRTQFPNPKRESP